MRKFRNYTLKAPKVGLPQVFRSFPYHRTDTKFQRSRKWPESGTSKGLVLIVLPHKNPSKYRLNLIFALFKKDPGSPALVKVIAPPGWVNKWFEKAAKRR